MYLTNIFNPSLFCLSGQQESCHPDFLFFALLFINYIYSDRCFELWICIGICKRMWANDNNWDGIWCNTRLCPILGKKFRDIGCQTVKYDK